MSRRLLWFAPFILAACQDAAAPAADYPAKPDALEARATPGEIVLEWRDLAENELSYRVEVSSNGGPWVLLIETAANVVNARHSNVQHNVTYSYRVASCNATGCSDYVLASAKWETSPPALTTFGATDIGAYNVTLRATALSSGLPTRFWFVVTKAGSNVPVVTTDRLVPFAASDTAGMVSITHVLFNLEPLTEYAVTAFAENAAGETSAVEPKPFKTSGTGPPAIGTMVVLVTGRWQAMVNPNGLTTYCTFELVHAGDSFDRPFLIRTDMAEPVGSDVMVEAKFWDLVPGQSYSWRVIATNSAGTVTSPVHTFTYGR